jgi:hypothetical protein
MRSNLGSTDKIIRAILGVAIIGAGVYLNSWWGLVGIVLISEVLISWCPAYAVFGVSTSTKE